MSIGVPATYQLIYENDGDGLVLTVFEGDSTGDLFAT